MNNNANGGTWDELQEKISTPKEIAASNLRAALIGELVKAGQEKGLSQNGTRKLDSAARYRPKGFSAAGKNPCDRTAQQNEIKTKAQL